MKYDNLPKDELERTKLIEEIKSHKKVWRIPAFWAFLAVTITTVIGFYTGFFDAQKAKLELDTAVLEARRDTLNKKINDLERRLQITTDSMQEVISLQEYQIDSLDAFSLSILESQDSIKQAYKVWKKETETKENLLEEIDDFVKQVTRLDQKRRDCLTNLMQRKRKVQSNIYKKIDPEAPEYRQLLQTKSDSVLDYFFLLERRCENRVNAEATAVFRSKALYLRNRILSYNVKIEDPINIEKYYRLESQWARRDVFSEIMRLAEKLRDTF